MKHLSLATIAAALAAAFPHHAAAQAQEAAVQRLAQLAAEVEVYAHHELGSERVVKGAPYCADATHETVQPLADGNRIVRSQTTRLCRDGEGRTRQEIKRGGRTTVYLHDPVARESWVLDPQAKTATRSAAGRGVSAPEAGGSFPFDHGAWRDWSERMRDWARQMRDQVRDQVREPGVGDGQRTAPLAPTPPTANTPPAAPAPAAINLPAGDASRHAIEVIRIAPSHVSNTVAGPRAPLAVDWRSQLAAPRGAGVSTPLPAREIEGLKVNGERTTWTIEAGRIGNEKPILIVREVWTSPELMLTVATKDSDPRSGEVNYRLGNVKRDEPDAALMKPPADYAVRDLGRTLRAPVAPTAPVPPIAPIRPTPPTPAVAPRQG